MTVVKSLPENLKLKYGSHSEAAHEYCVMEAVAYVSGEPHSDHPSCACPVISSFARVLNDRMDTATRQRLIPYIVRIVGTKATPEIELQRAFIASDFAVREALPAALDAIKLTAEANNLRHLKPITDVESARAATATARAATASARAAAAAAEAESAEAAAESASAWAWESAEAAAESASAWAAAAAEAAAESASAWAAAWSAAWSAEAAAGDTWSAALQALDRMIDVGQDA